jgi:ligand-binding sensor domain-containing protein
VNAVIKDDKTGNLFCGTDLGVYIIKDGCKKWLALNANIPASASVQDLLIHPSDRKLIIATYGRGVYAWDDVNVLK